MMSDVLIWANVCRAEHVINSETEDIPKRVKEITGTCNCLHSRLLHHVAAKHLPIADASSVNHCKAVACHFSDACASLV